MEKTPKFFIVEATALPEIFLKVAEAKRMLETGETDKVNEATRAVGISRSAFYKYRDCIAPFQNLMAGRIITFQIMLKNKAGVLSALLSIFAGCGANILTINQAIPTGGRAMVTVSAETGELQCSLEELLHRIESTPGVVKAELTAAPRPQQQYVRPGYTQSRRQPPGQPAALLQQPHRRLRRPGQSQPQGKGQQHRTQQPHGRSARRRKARQTQNPAPEVRNLHRSPF